MRIKVTTKINKSASEVFSRFGDGLFEKLVPSFARVLRNDGISLGSIVSVKLPFMKTWHSEIIDVYRGESYYFTDRGLSGMPFLIKEWKHTHKVVKINDKSCFIVDDIEFTTGMTVLDWLVEIVFTSSMLSRRRIYKRFFN